MTIDEVDFVLKTLILLRRSTAEEWSTQNPVLSEGEPGVELDTFRLKVGDGATSWNDLPYVDNRQLTTIATITNEDFVLQGSQYIAEKSIAHNMKKYPVISMVDNDGEAVNGKIAYIDENNLTITLKTSIAPLERTLINIYAS